MRESLPQPTVKKRFGNQVRVAMAGKRKNLTGDVRVKTFLRTEGKN
jgi:hypothetical protein